MQGRAFLNLARRLTASQAEEDWRGAAIHAYYALMLECRDALARWGFVCPRGQGIHPWVRLRFTYAGDAHLNSLGDALDQLVRRRNKASYDLNPSPTFATVTEAALSVQQATAALALLDQIDRDP